MSKNKVQKLELTWPGKENRLNPEPRILIEDKDKSFSLKVGEKVENDLFDIDESNNKKVVPTFDNMLIHGDNLLALKALEQEYAGKVKCIYIDPPYNTGNAFEHYDDGYEHSIWLSLMRDRLEILKRLLSDDGVIFIQIDDNEMAYLKIMLDEIFGRDNFINTLPTVMNLKGNQDQFCFAGTHEYILTYAKNHDKTVVYSLLVEEDDILADWDSDDIGLFKKGATLKATGTDALREKRPAMFFPILVNRGTLAVSTIKQSEYDKIYSFKTKAFNDNYVAMLKIEYEKQGFEFILPADDAGKWTRWRWGWNQDTFKKLTSEVIVSNGRKGLSLYKKQRPEVGDIPTRKPKSLFYKPEYSSGNGTAQIKALFGYKAFNYPKPEELISDLITIATKPGDLVLDSFLGSGTTAAVAHKMGRHWIGIEMGEHCYTHCLPRLKKVIKGEDTGGITKSVGWTKGGGFKFYELASSLIVKDKHGKEIISNEYNPEMLAEAMCKLMGYTYAPDKDFYFKQGYSSEKSFIYTTTMSLQEEALGAISRMLGKQNLLICCGAFTGNIHAYENITVKKIPAAVLKKCEWGKPGYPLPTRSDFKDSDFEFEE